MLSSSMMWGYVPEAAKQDRSSGTARMSGRRRHVSAAGFA